MQLYSSILVFILAGSGAADAQTKSDSASSSLGGSTDFRRYGVNAYWAESERGLDSFGFTAFLANESPADTRFDDFNYQGSPKDFLDAQIDHPAYRNWLVHQNTASGFVSAYGFERTESEFNDRAFEGAGIEIGGGGTVWLAGSDGIGAYFSGSLGYDRVEIAGQDKVSQEFPVTLGAGVLYRPDRLALGWVSDRFVEQVGTGFSNVGSFESNSTTQGTWFSGSYATVFQIHSSKQNPLPSLFQYSATVSRETTIWQDEWLSQSLALHGTIGLWSTDTKPEGRHYSLGYSLTNFNKDDEEFRDLRRDSVTQGYGGFFADVEIVRFDVSSLYASINRYKRQYADGPDDRFWAVGLTLRRNF